MPHGTRSRMNHHPHLDNSCECDSEVLPYNCSKWDYELEDAMRRESLAYLTAHYPEFTFTWVQTSESKTPRGFEYKVYRAKLGMWLCATWRAAA